MVIITLNSHFSTLTSQLSLLNFHFSTFTSQLSTLNFQPSTYYPFPHKMSM